MCLDAPVLTIVRTLVSGTEQPCLMPTMGELMPQACPVPSIRLGTGEMTTQQERGSHFIEDKGKKVCV